LALPPDTTGPQRLPPKLMAGGRVLIRWLALVAVFCLDLHCGAQWIAGAYIGEAHTLNSALTVRQPALATDITFHDISYRGESFQTPLYYGVRGAYFFHPKWGVETEFIHLKVFANVDRTAAVVGTLNGAPIDAHEPVNAIIQRFSISHGVNLLLANAIFRHELWRSNGEKSAGAYVSLRLGAGATIPHAESTIQRRTDEHYQVGSPALQFAGTIELRIRKRWYWMGEYKFTRTREEVDVNSGTAKILLQTHHVVTGPSIHF
jgi:lipid A oxidase